MRNIVEGSFVIIKAAKIYPRDDVVFIYFTSDTKVCYVIFIVI